MNFSSVPVRMTPNEYVVEITGLIVGHAIQNRILNGINLQIDRGAIFSLVGPSGCGKTTLLRCIAGLVRPSSGSLKIFGSRGPCHPRDLGYMPQDITLFENLTIDETIFYFGRLLSMEGLSIRQVLDTLTDRLDLPDGSELISNLSGGEKRRISFVCAVIHSPSLLLLDEPTVGCDPLIRRKLVSLLVEMKNCTVIMTTHYVEEARRSSTKLAFMRDGKVLAQGHPEAIIRRLGVSTLEESFLKLCTSQSAHQSQESLFVGLRSPSQENLGVSSELKVKARKLSQRIKCCRLNKTLTPSNDQRYFKMIQALAWRMMKQYYRDRTPSLFYIIAALAMIFLFAYCFGRTPVKIPIGLVNQDRDLNLSRILVAHLNSTPLFYLRSFRSIKIARKSIRKGRIHGFLRIPELFSGQIPFRHPDSEVFEELGDYRFGRVTYTSSGLDPIIHEVIVRTLELALFNATQEIFRLEGKNPRLNDPPIVRDAAIFGQNNQLDLFNQNLHHLPRSIFFCSYIVTILHSASNLYTERLSSTLERTRSAGATSFQILISCFMVTLIFPILSSLLILFLPIVCLSVTYNGSYLFGWLIYLLSQTASVCASFLFATLNFDLSFIYMLITGYIFAGETTSGFLWSTNGLPYHIGWFSHFHAYYEPSEAFILATVKGVTLKQSSQLCRHIFSSLLFIIIVFSLTWFRLSRASK